jgi:hypothetical protein
MQWFKNYRGKARDRILSVPESLLRLLGWCMVEQGIVTGAFIMILGDKNWNGPHHFANALGVSPSLFWGSTIVLSGVFIGLGILKRVPRLRSWGYTIGAAWSFFFAINFFFNGVFLHNGQSGTGAIWLSVGLIYVVMGRLSEALLKHNNNRQE